MGVVHFILCIIMIIVASTKGAPFTLQGERFWKKIDKNILKESIIYEPVCGNCTTTDDCLDSAICKSDQCEYDDVYDWFDCLRDLRERDKSTDDILDDDTSARLYVVEPSNYGFGIKVWVYYHHD